MWIKLAFFGQTPCCLTSSEKRKERILHQGTDLLKKELDIVNLIKS